MKRAAGSSGKVKALATAHWKEAARQRRVRRVASELRDMLTTRTTPSPLFIESKHRLHMVKKIHGNSTNIKDRRAAFPRTEVAIPQNSEGW